MKSNLRVLFPAALAGLLAVAGMARASAADTGVTERTLRQVLVESAGLGSDLRDRIEAVGKMVAENETARAMREADVLLAEFKKQMPEDGSVYVSVSSDEQFADFAGQNRGKKVLRVAWGLQKLYFIKAFILAEEKPQEALPVLDEMQKYAPFSSDARCERGYVLNLLGHYADALAAYCEAQKLAAHYPSEKHNAPVVWRGSGYSLARLGRLEEARAAYAKSLEIEPENPIAHDGLAAIEQQEKNAKKAAETAKEKPAAPAMPEATAAKPGAGLSESLPEME